MLQELEILNSSAANNVEKLIEAGFIEKLSQESFNRFFPNTTFNELSVKYIALVLRDTLSESFHCTISPAEKFSIFTT